LPQLEEPFESQTKTFQGLPQELERGSLFAGRYEIIEELGSGGMGRVYKVYDRKIKETIGLKLIRPELASRPKTLERFREEIRLARRITHKNVCRMHDINEEQGTPYITMEYVQGEDLKSMIRMMGRLSPGQAASVGKQICAGLAEAHHLGIIHRDLKPKNIMMDREGKARIMDFGLARSLEEKGITGGGVIMGTAEYMSPEQVEGKKADNRSDIYSLGVILFEMVTGRLPFDGDTALSIAVKHKTEPPPDPRKINPQIPETLSRLILKCLEKEKEKRYQTVEDLVSELEKIEKEFPSDERILPQKKPRTLRELTRPFTLRKIRIPASIFLIVVLVAIFLWLFLSRKEITQLPAGKPSLAILHFKNNTGDSNLDIWRTALPDNLISEIRRLSNRLTVLSFDHIETILDRVGLAKAASYTSEDLKAVAEKTKISHILIASYAKAADELRLIYELKDARTAEAIYDGRVEGKGEDFLRMCDNLAAKILENFNLQAAQRAEKPQTTSPLASRYYELGRNSERKFRLSGPKDSALYGEAEEWFKRAIQEDPNFALPYWGLGDLHESLYVDKKRKEDLRKTLQYYKQAYSLDPNFAGTNAGMGWAYFLQGDNDKAYEYFKWAVELEPENPSINFNIGSFLRSIGLPDLAIKYYSLAISQGDPSLKNYQLRAKCYEDTGKAEEAVADAKKMLEMEPDNMSVALYYSRMLIMLRKLKEAEKEIEIVANLSPSNANIQDNIQYTKALLFAARGEKEKALALVKKAEGEDPVFYTYLLSRVYAILGLKEKALKNIQLAIEKGFEEIQEYMYNHFILESIYFYDPLRNDPRFIDLLKQQKEKYYRYLGKYKGL